jgi:hypothetical protein
LAQPQRDPALAARARDILVRVGGIQCQVAKPNGAFVNWTAYPQYAYDAFVPNPDGESSPTSRFVPSALITNAGPYTPHIYPYGVGGFPGTYAAKNGVDTPEPPERPLILQPQDATERYHTRVLRPDVGPTIQLSIITQRMDELVRVWIEGPGAFGPSLLIAPARAQDALRVLFSALVQYMTALGDTELADAVRVEHWTAKAVKRTAPRGHGGVVWLVTIPVGSAARKNRAPEPARRPRKAKPTATAATAPKRRTLSGGAEWPVHDRAHALLAVRYMAGGFGGQKWRSQYPTMLRKLAKFWPVEDERNRDIWTAYRQHREQIAKYAAAVPTIAQLRRVR